MERLALISAVMLPLTLLAGIYGMSIIVNDRTQTWELSLVLISMGCSRPCAVLLAWAQSSGLVVSERRAPPLAAAYWPADPSGRIAGLQCAVAERDVP